MEMERLETVLTSMVEGIVVTDRDSRVILFNPAAQKLFDLVPHRVIHQPVEKVCELGGVSVLAGFKDLGSHAIRGHKEPVTLWGMTAVSLGVD